MKLAALFVAVLFPALATVAEDRPAKWAQPVKDAKIENLNCVTPVLYRSAQPDADGFRAAEKMGIRSVLDLRDNHSDAGDAKGTGLRILSVGMNAWKIDEDQVVQALSMLRKKEDGPFLVHCYHGADRTGLVIAMVRIIEQGWSKEDALAEMKDGGFNFHSFWRNITTYIEKLDAPRIAAIRKRVDELAAGK